RRRILLPGEKQSSSERDSKTFTLVQVRSAFYLAFGFYLISDRLLFRCCHLFDRPECNGTYTSAGNCYWYWNAVGWMVCISRLVQILFSEPACFVSYYT